MDELIKTLSATVSEILNDAIVTVVQNVIKHCSGEEISSVSPLVDYILAHPEYEINTVHTPPPNSTKIYKVSYKGEEMACCTLSYYFDLCNPEEVNFNVETIYSYDENKNVCEKVVKKLPQLFVKRE